MTKAKEVVIVGAGVSGLTSAVRLLEDGYAVRVIAAELASDPAGSRMADGPPGICSPRAAAVWYPYHVHPADRVARWGAASLVRYREMVADPSTGVSMVPLTIFFGDDPGDAEWARLEGCDREMIPPDELPPGYAVGVRLAVPFIDTTVFLPYLEARVRALGGTIERRPPLRSLDEARRVAPVVVNCTGLGARALCGDEAMVPVRGQVLRVRPATAPRWTVALPKGSPHPLYVLPRTHDCILGGTDEPGAWDETPEEATLAWIEAECRALEPALGEGYEILGTAAGLRPAREGGVRLEAEAFDEGGGAVVHNYGHGGAGFTLCWGCAAEVAALVGEQAPVPIPTIRAL